jgi:hypothetical protein
MDLDPGGPKTCGSGSPTLICGHIADPFDEFVQRWLPCMDLHIRMYSIWYVLDKKDWAMYLKIK